MDELRILNCARDPITPSSMRAIAKIVNSTILVRPGEVCGMYLLHKLLLASHKIKPLVDYVADETARGFMRGIIVNQGMDEHAWLGLDHGTGTVLIRLDSKLLDISQVIADDTTMAGKSPKCSALSDQMRQAIRDSGFSRYAISEATGIQQATLSRFMSGESGISLATADLLAEYLNLKLAPRKGK